MLPLNDTDLLRHAMLIGGEWVQADSGQSLEVRNPATGEVAGFVPNGGAAEPRRAMPFAERRQVIEERLANWHGDPVAPCR